MSDSNSDSTSMGRLFGRYVSRFLLPFYRHVRIVEQSHRPLTWGDFVLLIQGLSLDDESFNRLVEDSSYWVHCVINPEEGKRGPSVDSVFTAMKLLVGISEELVLRDELEKEYRPGGNEVRLRTRQRQARDDRSRSGAELQRVAVGAARKRVERAKKELVPRLVKPFSEGFERATELGTPEREFLRLLLKT